MFLYDYRFYNKKILYDPTDIACIEGIDFWMVKDELQIELDYDELEGIL